MGKHSLPYNYPLQPLQNLTQLVMGMISPVEYSLVESSSNKKCWQCVLQIIQSSSEAVSAEYLGCNFYILYMSQTKLKLPHLDLGY